MKRTVLFLLAVLIIGALALVPAISGAAKASRITTCALQTNTAEIPGKMWFSDDGTILHIRGQITYADIEPLPGHPECDPAYSRGQLEMELNVNLNVVTGEGNAYGKQTIRAEGLDGSWVGAFQGKITGTGYTGRALSHGTGDLAGLLQKVNIVQTGEATYETYGYVLDR
jgi:hypothetical protein